MTFNSPDFIELFSKIKLQSIELEKAIGQIYL